MKQTHTEAVAQLTCTNDAENKALTESLHVSEAKVHASTKDADKLRKEVSL